MTESFAQGTDFSLDAYKSMRDDGARTPTFVEAINKRIKGKEGEQAPVYAVAGTQVGAALAAQEEGFYRVLQAQRRIPSIFPGPSLFDKLARLRSRP